MAPCAAARVARRRTRSASGFGISAALANPTRRASADRGARGVSGGRRLRGPPLLGAARADISADADRCSDAGIYPDADVYPDGGNYAFAFTAPSHAHAGGG